MRRVIHTEPPRFDEQKICTRSPWASDSGVRLLSGFRIEHAREGKVQGDSGGSDTGRGRPGEEEEIPEETPEGSHGEGKTQGKDPRGIFVGKDYGLGSTQKIPEVTHF